MENPFEAEEAQTPIFAAEESEASQATSQVEPTEAVEPADPDVAADVAESVDTEESSDTGVSVDTMESSDTTASSEANDYAELIDEPERGGQGLKWLIALVVIVLLGGIGYYCYYSAKESEKELEAIAAQKRADSIAAALREEEEEAARREEARLDSIRQDSIARRNFITPDLAFHDLHGDVKECVCDDDNEYLTYTYTFDENGRWTNEPQWEEWEIEYAPEKTKHPKVIRNKEGYITRIYNSCDCDIEYADISCNLRSDFTNYDDFLTITVKGEYDELPGEYTITYCNYEVDGMGNWVKRDAIKKIRNIYDNSISYEKSTQTRTITYYKGNGNSRVSIPNNAKQEQALRELDSNDPRKNLDWIYGTWLCSGTMDYRSWGGGVQDFSAKVIITKYSLKSYHNGELKYNGSYDIEDGEIRYNRKNGYAFSIPIDYSNRRLKFGDGKYFTKVSSEP